MKEKEIRQLIKILEETGIAELEVKKWWGERVRIVKDGAVRNINEQDNPAQRDGMTIEVPSKPEIQAGEEPEKSYYAVTSPMVGTFYRAPAPGEAPFVSVGDTVKAGQTLCIIEAMKIMNEIEAEVNGTVVEILVDNAQPVEFSQPLFYIDESK